DTFGESSAARRSWARKAAEAHRQYVDWFVGLEPIRQDRLIESVSQHRRSAPGFPEYRLRWILSRVGNAVYGIGSCLVRAADQTGLFTEYARLGNSSVEVFPEEAVKEWYKWLRSLPDFKFLRASRDLSSLIKENPDAEDSWREFHDFLGKYVNANPSVSDRWKPVRTRVSQWLD